MNQITPDGTLTYNQTGEWGDGTPRIDVTQTLSPNNQQLYDTNQQTQLALAGIGKQQAGQIGSLLASPFDMSQGAIDGRTAGMPALPQYRAGAATYGSAGDPFAGQLASGLASVQQAAGNVGPAAPQARYTDASAFQTQAPGRVASRYTTAPDQVQTRQIGSNDQLEGQLYDAAFSRYQPQLDRNRQALETSLANKGLQPGSAGYENAMQGLDQSENDLRAQTFLQGQNQAFTQSATRAQNDFSQDLASSGQFFNQNLQANGQKFNQDLSAVAQDFDQRLKANAQNFGLNLQANAQNYGQDVSNAQYGMSQDAMRTANALSSLGAVQNAQGTAFQQGMAADQFGVSQDQYAYGANLSARQQALNELLTQRQTPMNEITALLSGAQVTRPQWTATPQTTVQPADLSGLVSKNYQTQMQGYTGMLGGLASLGGSIASLGFAKSDERLKRNIRQIARLPNGLGLYSYEFHDGRREIGLLAQEVQFLDPGAVRIDPDGFMAVDYRRALEAA